MASFVRQLAGAEAKGGLSGPDRDPDMSDCASGDRCDKDIIGNSLKYNSGARVDDKDAIRVE